MSTTTDRRTSVTVRVPAKVNVRLAVGGARPDGYHDLANVFLAVSLYDEVTAVESPGGVRVTCSGPDAHQVPLDRTNLAARAAEALAARHGIAPDVHLHIAKDIPVAGGMAGGSADGAAALLACDTLWGLSTPREELLSLCADLGSDVPFSLLGGAALGTGRGEHLTALPVGGDFHWVFAVADGGLSTPAVYAEFDRLTAGALAALVSGSGPTTAFLVEDPAAAAQVAAALLASGTCRTARIATSPAQGAVVVSGTA
ncbi:4-(cytidine 5'-diphospho)-2-C-methyl-D-erythritol kinase [Streptomyces solincola]|uniref:4-diphosphocytidyl-2-C-methyl-D-erythritol kinase n=1 Tax=Streptomyces solincola TaxID=2100817 RepID=A0A2S9Q2S8_9ACTN|nr:4-(cytidine 5'-diphospho)-2-C-methyl-D-erythritol kinase [Streptomyces solincola]PRH80980.1 4-(cytidine 5'-diphospho)-2-C-methyl-D-erythritol kinase [Streptomyces solincola]